MRYSREELPLVSANLLRLVYMVGIGIVLQLYLKELGASPFVISLSEVAFWGAMLLFAPLWGAMSDASGRRKIFLVGGMLGPALMLPVFGILTTTETVLGLRFLFSVAAVAFPPVALAALSDGRDAAERGRSLSSYHTSRALGFLVGWGGAGLVVDFLGFQGAFLVFGGVATLGLLAALRVTGVDAPEPVSAREVVETAKSRWVPDRDDGVFRQNGLHYLLAGIFLRKVAFVGIFALIAVYAVDVLGLTRGLLGILLAVNPLSQLVFLDFFGLVADRRGRRFVLLVGFLFTIPVPFLLLHAANPWVFAGAYAIFGFAFAAIMQGSTAFIGDVAPGGRQGELMGFRKSAQGLAGVVGPLLAGAIATVYGYQEMLLVMGALCIAAFVLVWKGTAETVPDVDGNASLREAFMDAAWYLHLRR